MVKRTMPQELGKAMSLIKEYCASHDCHIEGIDQSCPLLINEEQCFFEDRLLASNPARWPINIINHPTFEMEVKEK